MSGVAPALRPWLAAAVAGAVLFAVVVLGGDSPAAREDFPLDDAWIHLVYARGILRDGMPTYNPGIPEAGFSSPLWLALVTPVLALARALHAAPVLPVKLLSLLCAVVAAGALGALARRLGVRDSIATLVPALALLGPGLALSAPSGMEVPLAAATMTLALGAAQRGRWRRAGLWAGLALLARPECGVFVVALAGCVLARRAPGRERLRAVVALLLPAMVLGALWVAWNFAVSAKPFPNTFYVKAEAAPPSQALRFLAAVLGEGGAPFLAAALALAALGAFTLARRAPHDAARLGACIALPLLATLASRGLDPAIGFYARRYVYPFLALAWIPVAVGGDEALRRLERLAAWPRGLAWGAVGALVVAAVATWLPATAALHAATCEDIAALHTAPGRALRHTPPGTLLAVEGAGSIAFHAERPVLDLVGLNDHRLVRWKYGSLPHRCRLALLAPPVFVIPARWVPLYGVAFEFRELGRHHRAAYAQLVPPAPHTVAVLLARPSAELVARCRTRYGPRGEGLLTAWAPHWRR